MKVCIIDKNSTFREFTNYQSLFETIKYQINFNQNNSIGFLYKTDEKISEKVLLEKAAFTYSNCVIEDERVFIDVRPIKTPAGVVIKNMLDCNDCKLSWGVLFVGCIENNNIKNIAFSHCYALTLT